MNDILKLETFFSKKTLINTFDEEFLKEKSIALEPIDFSEVEELEKKLDREINKEKKIHKHEDNRKIIKASKKQSKKNKEIYDSNIIIINSKLNQENQEDLLSYLVAKAIKNDKVLNSVL